MITDVMTHKTMDDLCARNEIFAQLPFLQNVSTKNKIIIGTALYLLPSSFTNRTHGQDPLNTMWLISDMVILFLILYFRINSVMLSNIQSHLHQDDDLVQKSWHLMELSFAVPHCDLASGRLCSPAQKARPFPCR